MRGYARRRLALGVAIALGLTGCAEGDAPTGTVTVTTAEAATCSLLWRADVALSVRNDGDGPIELTRLVLAGALVADVALAGELSGLEPRLEVGQAATLTVDCDAIDATAWTPNGGALLAVAVHARTVHGDVSGVLTAEGTLTHVTVFDNCDTAFTGACGP